MWNASYRLRALKRTLGNQCFRHLRWPRHLESSTVILQLAHLVQDCTYPVILQALGLPGGATFKSDNVLLRNMQPAMGANAAGKALEED